MDIMFKGEITFRNYRVVVEKEDTGIYCFKHTAERCEMKIFRDYDEMIEWVLTPFPDIIYGLVLDEKS